MMFRRERGADLVELLNLACNPAQPLVNLLPNVNQVNVVESIVDRTLQQFVRSFGWEIGISQRVETRIMKAVIGKRDQPARRFANLLVGAEQQRFVTADYDSLDIGGKL